MRELMVSTLLALVYNTSIQAQQYNFDQTFDTDGVKVYSTQPLNYFMSVLLKDDGSSWAYLNVMNTTTNNYTVGLVSLLPNGSANSAFGVNGSYGWTNSQPMTNASELFSTPNGGCWGPNDFFPGGICATSPTSTEATLQVNTSYSNWSYGSVQVNDSVYVMLTFNELYSYRDRKSSTYGAESLWFNGSYGGSFITSSPYHPFGDQTKEIYTYNDALGMAQDGGILIPAVIQKNMGADGYQIGLLKLLPNSLNMDTNFGTGGWVEITPIHATSSNFRVHSIRSLTDGRIVVSFNDENNGSPVTNIRTYSTTGVLANSTTIPGLSRRLEVDAQNNIYAIMNGQRIVYAYSSSLAPLAINGTNNYVDLPTVVSSTNLIDVYGSSINSTGDIMISGGIKYDNLSPDVSAVLIKLKRASNGSGVGINETEANQLICYPNPVKMELNIDNLSGEYAYSIYNSVGQLVQSESHLINSQISVAKLESGMYTIQLLQNKQVITTRFIKE